MTEKTGRRADSERVLYKDGDYWKEGGFWFARLPGSKFAMRLHGNKKGDFNETNYEVTEHGDGTISIPGIIEKGVWQ